MDLRPIPAIIQEFDRNSPSLKDRADGFLLSLQRFVRDIEADVATKSARIRASSFHALDMLSNAELDGWSIDSTPTIRQLTAIRTKIATDRDAVLPLMKRVIKQWRQIDREMFRKAEVQYNRLKSALDGADTELEDFIEALSSIQRRMTPEVVKSAPMNRANAAYSSAIQNVGLKFEQSQVSTADGPFLLFNVYLNPDSVKEPAALALLEDAIHETVNTLDPSLVGRAVISFLNPS